jgi:arylsulfatase A-like enzyme
MNRATKHFAAVCSKTLLLGVAVVLGLTAPVRAGEKRPNVILILIDDQGYGDMSCNGNPVLKTPEMDALAAEGVRLNDFHVSPLCSPTRSALLTGRYCRKVGVHGTNFTEQHMAVEAVTAANLFAANGYATGIFGKWHLGDRYPLRPMDRGFAESVVFPDGAVSTIPDHWGNHYFDDTYWHNGRPQKYKGYCTDVWFDLALQFIETNKDRPFFCYLPTNAAHYPYLVPEQYAKPYQKVCKPDIANFYGMIAKIDEDLGRFRKRLAELGLDRDTILIFMGDNGTPGCEFTADMRGKKFNAGMRGEKGSPYDGGHRVACFIRYPSGGITGGRVVNQLSANVDILPTLVDLCRLKGRPKLPAFDGVSLVPALVGKGEPNNDRVIIESFRRVVMTQRWRLVNEHELYDMQKDPGQTQDVAAQFPEVVAQLTRQLEEYRKTEDLRPHYVVIGSERQNPVTLTGEDWQVVPPIWQETASIPQKHDPGSVWNVQVARAGHYRLALRRWPRETATAINATLPKEKWCHGMHRCVPLEATEAKISVKGAELSQPVTDATQKAEFTLDLPAGPATIRGWFVGKDKQLWSAYYLYAERVIEK